MSFEIPKHFVKQYNANVTHLSQQKGSRLRMAVRQESHQGEEAYYDRIDATSAVKKASRHSDTPRIDTPHDRRKVMIDDYEWADLVDKQDRLRTLYDPTNPYAVAAGYAMGRSMDDVMIEAATGTAYAGKNGTDAIVLPNSQKIAATDGASLSQLNVLTLRKVKEKFDEADVDDEDRYFAYSANELYNLLGDNNITSADYNTVKALVNGEVDTYMGFKFVRSQRLQKTIASTTVDAASGAVGTGSDSVAIGATKCFAFCRSGLLLSVGQDVITRVDERKDKSYATQVYCSMSIGATRMEEVKVVEVLVGN